jgi:hypothetical protein
MNVHSFSLLRIHECSFDELGKIFDATDGTKCLHCRSMQYGWELLPKTWFCITCSAELVVWHVALWSWDNVLGCCRISEVMFWHAPSTAYIKVALKVKIEIRNTCIGCLNTEDVAPQAAGHHGRSCQEAVGQGACKSKLHFRYEHYRLVLSAREALAVFRSACTRGVMVWMGDHRSVLPPAWQVHQICMIWCMMIKWVAHPTCYINGTYLCSPRESI